MHLLFWDFVIIFILGAGLLSEIRWEIKNSAKEIKEKIEMDNIEIEKKLNEILGEPIDDSFED